MIDQIVAGFDTEFFCDFLRAKFPSFSPARRAIRLNTEFPWESAARLGIVKTLPGAGGMNQPLLVVAAKLTSGETLRERSSRLRQFKFARDVLSQAMAEPAPGIEGVITQGLFVFYDDDGNFRLSLVFGKAEGVKLVWSTAKRLSFHVEAGTGNKTFRDRMVLPWPSFDKLKDAFSVEKLTKEFYGRLFAWYQQAMADPEAVFPNDIVKDKEPGEVKSEQIIRLITRLMFVWFLKQKGLVPDTLFDATALKTILKDFSLQAGENYYRAILQNLFFATLNSEIPDRAFAVDAGKRSVNIEHFDIKTLYRYGADFAIGQPEVLALFRTIPFLNGGLFECLDRGRDYFDGFSRNIGKQARIPNRLFFDEKTGLIPLLSLYHFTVEENSPGDEEVALDPELLGKVFENLLGAYNPETEVAARKATGSFYTPREIVNYMVDESLVAHVKGKVTQAFLPVEKGSQTFAPANTADSQTGMSVLPWEDALTRLFTDGERPADEALCKRIDAALVTAKILDPACGSGAFPMGMLLRMVELLRVLRRIPPDESVYDLKLELIENCIYGADIQCIAVQISKLRFFISLVCEEKGSKKEGNTGIPACVCEKTQTGMSALRCCAENNYGIHTLPNLETKFVAADSLIGLARDGETLPMQNVVKLKEQLWAVRHKHFTARSYREKKELRKEDSALRTALAKALEEGGGFDTESAKLMAAWDPYDQNTSATFSDPEWMFNVKDGFDVVIGNPPYVQIQKLPDNTKTRLSEQSYRTFSKTADLYCLFYEQGLRLLRDSATLGFITSNKFFRAGYGKPLRRLLTEENTLLVAIDFGELPVFEAGTDPCILIVAHRPRLGNTASIHAAIVKDVSGIQNVRWTLESSGFDLDPASLNIEGWTIEGGAGTALLGKIRTAGMPLGEYVKGRFYRGVLTGLNEAFVIDRATRDRLIAEDPKSADLLKPWLRGKDIRRWYADYQDLYVINILSGANQKWPWTGMTANKAEACFKQTYPAIYCHLSTYRDKLQAREDKGQYYWELRSCAYHAEFEQPKIVYADIAKLMRASFDTDGAFCANTMYIIPSSDFLLLGLLNSSVFDWFARNTFQSLGDPWKGGRMRYIAQYMQNVPIPPATSEQRKVIESLVTRILAAKKADPDADTSVWEAEIDRLVYELYGLTDEEIAIVERHQGGTGIPACGNKEGAIGIPACGKGKKTQTGMSVLLSRRKANLPPSRPGWD